MPDIARRHEQELNAGIVAAKLVLPKVGGVVDINPNPVLQLAGLAASATVDPTLNVAPEGEAGIVMASEKATFFKSSALLFTIVMIQSAVCPAVGLETLL